MNDAPATRRRFRFGLRTLLALVTLAAVASWGYWIGWPWWRDYREQMQFEKSVTQLKAALWPAQDAQFVQWGNCNRFWTTGTNADGNPIFSFCAAWPTTIYCIYFVLPRSIPKVDLLHAQCTSVEVFRWPPMPINYHAPAKWDRVFKTNLPSSDWNQQHKMSATYIQDLHEFISGDRKNNPGFQYELIYSDPPAKPEGK